MIQQRHDDVTSKWQNVDSYISDHLIQADPILEKVLASNQEAGLPAIDVAPNQGKLLNILARLVNATRILEIGTLGGYSTIWLARALPETGKLMTLEFNPAHARIAQMNLDAAGLSKHVTLKVGPALATLPTLDPHSQFDMVFIDADKRNNTSYLDWAVRLSRPGALIVVDNVVRDGAILDAGSTDPDVQGIRAFFDMLATDPRLTATALQTVGSKGWDGMAIALVN